MLAGMDDVTVIWLLWGLVGLVLVLIGLVAVLATKVNRLTQQVIQQEPERLSLIAACSKENTEKDAQLKHFIFELFSEQKQFVERLYHEKLRIDEKANEHLKRELIELLSKQDNNFNRNFLDSMKMLNDQLVDTGKSLREELNLALKQNGESLERKMAELTQSTDNRLKSISEKVEQKLSDGFEKTTETFNDILKRLALIDVAQKTITSLSSEVVSLQQVLADKRSRGAFGEVQLSGLIRNILAENQFALQHTLSNGKIADCVLFLPPPTGNVVVDAKFPLESYRRMSDVDIGEADRKVALRQFKQDVRKHINDIADKYLISNETSDGAIMFIPAEAIFAEIHAHHPDVLEQAYQRRVWLASPTTLMAILTTARSVLKDEATQKQVHIIQQHLVHLGSDFQRFRTRFDNLAKHIDQAATDVQQIHTSANKITSRFDKIEKVEVMSSEGIE